MQVNACMTRDVELVSPQDTIQTAAQAMAKADTGALPVGEGDRLVGMITDRDIAIRAVASGKDPQCRVADAMSGDLCYCFEDEDVSDVLQNMSRLQVRRLPVVDREKRLVGIVSLSDLTRGGSPEQMTGALDGIARPGGDHSQHLH